MDGRCLALVPILFFVFVVPSLSLDKCTQEIFRIDDTHPHAGMKMKMYLRLIAVVVTVALSASSSRGLCPSPPLTYASVGDNVTLCWKIPEKANTSHLKRFTILALKRPVQQEMQQVASAGKDGQFYRAYKDKHDGVYKGRVIVDADLQARLLFLKLSNYTKGMENVYCVMYEMSVINDLLTCHSDALFLRNNDDSRPQIISTITTTNGFSNYTLATDANSTEIPAQPTRPSKGRTDAREGESYRTELIIVSGLLGVVLVVVICIVIWYRRTRPSKRKSARGGKEEKWETVFIEGTPAFCN